MGAGTVLVAGRPARTDQRPRRNGGGLPTFSSALSERRCVIPATGFDEWRKAGARKVPMPFRLAAGGMMGFAGLWEKSTSADGRKVLTCCVITTAANARVAPYHDRMPAVLAPADYATWLDADAPIRDAHALLKPCPADLMEAGEANPLVNSPKNEGPQLLDPAA